jgi:hypothetical protein
MDERTKVLISLSASVAVASTNADKPDEGEKARKMEPLYKEVGQEGERPMLRLPHYMGRSINQLWK